MVITYQNLFSARKLCSETQSEARLDDKVLVVRVATEVMRRDLERVALTHLER